MNLIFESFAHDYEFALIIEKPSMIMTGLAAMLTVIALLSRRPPEGS
jgi:hypothetical protein